MNRSTRSASTEHPTALRAQSLAAYKSAWFSRDPGNDLRLALSESTRGCSPVVRSAVLREIDRAHLYPDSDTEPLRSAIARHWSVNPDQVIVTNGADEALLLTVLALTSPGDRCVTTANTFPGYTACFELASVTATITPATEQGVDAASFAEAICDARLAILCNPHNPTGALLQNPIVHHLAQTAEQRQTTLIVDEAYGEFADPALHTSAWRLHPDSNVIVVRTFSKAYAIAGLRCGYVIARQDLAERITAMRHALPYNVNRFALVAAHAALQDSDYLADTLRLNQEARETLASLLRRSGFQVLNSQTNFLLVKVPSAEAVVQRLALKHQIIARTAAAMGFPDWIRIGIGAPWGVVHIAQALLDCQGEDSGLA